MSFFSLSSWFSSKSSAPLIVQVCPRLYEISIQDGAEKNAATWLETYKGRYMVWNIVPTIAADVFDNQIQYCKQTGKETPVLDELLRICYSMSSWLDCDHDNIAAVITSASPMHQSWSQLVLCSYLLYTSAYPSIRACVMHVAHQRANASNGSTDMHARKHSVHLMPVEDVKAGQTDVKSGQSDVKSGQTDVKSGQTDAARQALASSSVGDVTPASVQTDRNKDKTCDKSRDRRTGKGTDTGSVDVCSSSARNQDDDYVWGKDDTSPAGPGAHASDVPTRTHCAYLRYVLELVKRRKAPCESPFIMHRVILHGVPHATPGPPAGCRPVLSLFDGRKGAVMFSSMIEASHDGPKFYDIDEQAAVVPIEASLTGDIVLKLHHKPDGDLHLGTQIEHTPLFVYAFHSALVAVVGSLDAYGESKGSLPEWLFKEGGRFDQAGIITLDKQDLGISPKDSRFGPHFRMDILFSFKKRSIPRSRSFLEMQQLLGGGGEGDEEEEEGGEGGQKDDGYEALRHLIDKIPVHGHREYVHRPMLQVTPNPRDLVPEDELPSADTPINSVPVLYTFNTCIMRTGTLSSTSNKQNSTTCAQRQYAQEGGGKSPSSSQQGDGVVSHAGVHGKASSWSVLNASSATTISSASSATTAQGTSTMTMSSAADTCSSSSSACAPSSSIDADSAAVGFADGAVDADMTCMGDTKNITPHAVRDEGDATHKVGAYGVDSARDVNTLDDSTGKRDDSKDKSEQGGASSGVPSADLELRGLAMLLPSLLVLEPLQSERGVQIFGLHNCRLRIPLERITRCELLDLADVRVGEHVRKMSQGAGAGGGDQVVKQAKEDSSETGADASLPSCQHEASQDMSHDSVCRQAGMHAMQDQQRYAQHAPQRQEDVVQHASSHAYEQTHGRDDDDNDDDDDLEGRDSEEARCNEGNVKKKQDGDESVAEERSGREGGGVGVVIQEAQEASMKGEGGEGGQRGAEGFKMEEGGEGSTSVADDVGGTPSVDAAASEGKKLRSSRLRWLSWRSRSQSSLPSQIDKGTPTPGSAASVGEGTSPGGAGGGGGATCTEREDAKSRACLCIEWDCGEDLGTRCVSLTDSWAAREHGHVHDLAESIRKHKEDAERHTHEAQQGVGGACVSACAPLELSHDSKVLQGDDAHRIRAQLPLRFRNSERWTLLYGTACHGISFSTFLRKVEWCSPTLLLIKDDKYATFGAYCSAPWELHPSYFGTGECFVFKIRPDFQVYRWNREGNNYFMLARRREGIAIGGGAKNAIRLEPDFLIGTSGSCCTFNSPSLASSEDFRCLYLEVWGIDPL